MSLNIPIAGARSAAQASGNAGASGLMLSAAELTAMDVISRSVTAHLDDNPVQWNF